MGRGYKEAEGLWTLADGFERWGLSTEAREARAAYQDIMVDILISEALASSGRTGRPDQSLPERDQA